MWRADIFVFWRLGYAWGLSAQTRRGGRTLRDINLAPPCVQRWGEGAGKRGSFLSLFTFQTEPETQDGVAWGRLAGVP